MMIMFSSRTAWTLTQSNIVKILAVSPERTDSDLTYRGETSEANLWKKKKLESEDEYSWMLRLGTDPELHSAWWMELKISLQPQKAELVPDKPFNHSNE